MKKRIEVSFFSESKKWPRRMPKIRKITLKVIKIINKYFNKNYNFGLNIILSDKQKLTKLNKKYKKKDRDTDVLTFVTKKLNKELGKKYYCDIFFSIDTIEKFIKNNKVTLYDHFCHLLIHSFLHINGYEHKNLKEFDKMRKEEIRILKGMKIKNPYLL